MENRFDINQAVEFIFRDPDWLKKVGIGGLLTLTIIGSIPVNGWLLEIQRRVISGDEDPLPDWTNFGGYVLDGLQLIIIRFFYGGAIMILFFGILGFQGVALLTENEEAMLVSTGLLFLFLPILFILSTAVGLMLPIATSILADTGQIGQAFDLPRIFKLVRVNILQCLAAFVVSYVVNYVFGTVGYFLCCIGAFLVTPIASGINYHLYAQVYLNAVAKLEQQGNLASTE